MTHDHYEMRFAGSGGQGMMLMGDIMAEAAGGLDDKEIVLTRSYGPEARGGACRSELIIDTRPIDYPTVRHPDFVLAMSQEAADTYCKDVSSQGIFLVDPGFVHDIPKTSGQVYAIPLTELAESVTGNTLAANVVAIGAIAALTKVESLSIVKSAVLDHFKPKLRPLNEKAYDAGVAAAQALIK
ncbi:2-oxoacid:acceptor oxidoreductase family protein [Megasphaera hominis]|jgi:2-oxoglutarate ferredoxin oxidoreductase subunit gamma|uniref:2-oxoacid:acceptor oxidoreductase family protein n=1 Tax=Megasphaera hominis TaxID=159836 RepID=A0ABR6VHA2_9FIRM|nr:2-oxoacid:acceptor oxidoreductase family protein [Megasphaera hominis]MBC3536641.1 2-oxoacid:acceptor oxidoreductase family protein [Megasphaera hominis]